MSIKLHCIAPFIIKKNSNNLTTLFTRLAKNPESDYQLVESTERLQAEQEDLPISRYDTLGDDSQLSMDGFLQFRILNNNPDQPFRNESQIIVSDSEVLILHTIFERELDFKKPLCLDELQRDSNEYVNQIIKKIYTDLGLDTKHPDKNYFLWVNRTLECEEAYIEKNEKKVMYQWCYTEASILNALKEKGYFMAWGNNVLTVHADEIIKRNLIASIIVMQYYYTLLDKANEMLKRLTEQLSSFSLKRNKKTWRQTNNWNSRMLTETKAKIFTIRKHVRETLNKYNDDMISLQGFKQYFAPMISEIWKVNDLKESIAGKLIFCESITAEIETLNLKRGRFVTEMILFAVGLTSALSLMLDLGSFLDGNYGIKHGGFFVLIDHLPDILKIFMLHSFTGLLNLFSLILSLILIAIYMRYKRE